MESEVPDNAFFVTVSVYQFADLSFVMLSPYDKTCKGVADILVDIQSLTILGK